MLCYEFVISTYTHYHCIVLKCAKIIADYSLVRIFTCGPAPELTCKSWGLYYSEGPSPELYCRMLPLGFEMEEAN